MLPIYNNWARLAVDFAALYGPINKAIAYSELKGFKICLTLEYPPQPTQPEEKKKK